SIHPSIHPIHPIHPSGSWAKESGGWLSTLIANVSPSFLFRFRVRMIGSPLSSGWVVRSTPLIPTPLGCPFHLGGDPAPSSPCDLDGGATSFEGSSAQLSRTLWCAPSSKARRSRLLRA